MAGGKAAGGGLALAFSHFNFARVGRQMQACNTIGMIGMNHPNGGRNHPKDPCHWDEIIPMDGGWLPHWDEALDESTGIIEAVYFAPYL